MSAAPSADGVRAPSRARRRVTTAAVIAAFVLLTLLSWAVGVRTSDRPLAPDNPGPTGARAVAEILRERGVEVVEAATLAEVGGLAGPGTTVLAANLTLVGPDQLRELRATDADLVLAGNPFVDLSALDLPLAASGAGSDEPVDAGCDDPDAAAAGTISFTRGSVTADGDRATLCFPVGEGGGYAVIEEGAQVVRYLADPRLLTNEHLARDGNAALVLRALGQHPRLVWYLPTALDIGSTADRVPRLPPALTTALAVLAVAAAVLGLARGRSLGRVVTEDLPVVVRPAETTRGRGRLYRRAGARGHAAEGLRAATAVRLARALGVPDGAGPHVLADAVARATGRPHTEVDRLLAGPPPPDDPALLRLARDLDALEREGHR